MIDWPVNPKTTAYINIDLQNLFVEGYSISSPNGPAVVAQANRLAAACRAVGIMVIHTAQETRPDQSNRGIASDIVLSYMASHQMPHPFNAGDPAALRRALDLSPRLEVAKSDVILIKPRYGAFTGTDLDLILRSKGIDTVIIGGIATNVCCETTAREACTRDYKVFFLSDGTGNRGLAGLTPEQIKAAVLATLEFAFARVITVDGMIEKIEAGARAAA
ncbi:MAG: isochorismatase family cysteine hydrolase [Rhodospirillaceae bacterium]|nr:isochorismatase family cysteine hydrolase [Rhodospirillaceae bacterium]